MADTKGMAKPSTHARWKPAVTFDLERLDRRTRRAA
jgi:hypothetical protein